jgi:hypothetical protein
MARGWIHTVYRAPWWTNVVEGGQVLSRHHTKDTAVSAGREAAKRARTERLVHNLDGTIASRNSYLVRDPFPPRG